MFFLFENIEIRKFNAIDKFFVSLFLLLPLAIISGPFLSDLFLSLIGVYFIFITVRDGLWKYYKNYFVYVFLCFYIYLLFNSALSDDPIFSLRSSLFYFRYLFFILGAAYLIKMNNKIINYFLIILIILTVIIFFDSIIQFSYGYNIFGWKLIVSRVTSLFGDDLVMGRYYIHFTPILFGLLLIQNKKNYKTLIISLILLSMIFIIVFLSGGRSSFLSLILASFLIITSTSQFRKYSIYLIFFIFTLIATVFFNSSNLQDRYINQSLKQIYMKDVSYLLSREHEAVFITSLRMFTDKPLMGHGPNSFRHKCANLNYNVPLYGCSTHPHHTYLQLLAEIGIIGTIPFILGFLFLIGIYIRQFSFYIFDNIKGRLNDYRLCLFTSVMITMWPLTTSLNFFNNWINILYYIPFCFIMVKLEVENKEL